MPDAQALAPTSPQQSSTNGPAATPQSTPGSAQSRGAQTPRPSALVASPADVNGANVVPYPLVLDELMPRLLHCCYADSWQLRMGGVAALTMAIERSASVSPCMMLGTHTFVNCQQ